MYFIFEVDAREMNTLRVKVLQCQGKMFEEINIAVLCRKSLKPSTLRILTLTLLNSYHIKFLVSAKGLFGLALLESVQI